MITTLLLLLIPSLARSYTQYREYKLRLVWSHTQAFLWDSKGRLRSSFGVKRTWESGRWGFLVGEDPDGHLLSLTWDDSKQDFLRGGFQSSSAVYGIVRSRREGNGTEIWVSDSYTHLDLPPPDSSRPYSQLNIKCPALDPTAVLPVRIKVIGDVALYEAYKSRYGAEAETALRLHIRWKLAETNYFLSLLAKHQVGLSVEVVGISIWREVPEGVEAPSGVDAWDYVSRHWCPLVATPGHHTLLLTGFQPSLTQGSAASGSRYPGFTGGTAFGSSYDHPLPFLTRGSAASGSRYPGFTGGTAFGSSYDHPLPSLTRGSAASGSRYPGFTGGTAFGSSYDHPLPSLTRGSAASGSRYPGFTGGIAFGSSYDHPLPSLTRGSAASGSRYPGFTGGTAFGSSYDHPSYKSCSFLRTSAMTLPQFATAGIGIAHELGHSLGLHHDDRSGCGSGFIMDPMFPVPLPGLDWSPCSVERLKTTLGCFPSFRFAHLPGQQGSFFPVPLPGLDWSPCSVERLKTTLGCFPSFRFAHLLGQQDACWDEDAGCVEWVSDHGCSVNNVYYCPATCDGCARLSLPNKTTTPVLPLPSQSRLF